MSTLTVSSALGFELGPTFSFAGFDFKLQWPFVLRCGKLVEQPYLLMTPIAARPVIVIDTGDHRYECTVVRVVNNTTMKIGPAHVYQAGSRAGWLAGRSTVGVRGAD